eukprot:Amastigsp_a862577_2.p1 type:complete len:139 gc:universal Amastigsp_a862577_2:437-21(-)
MFFKSETRQRIPLKRAQAAVKLDGAKAVRATIVPRPRPRTRALRRTPLDRGCSKSGATQAQSRRTKVHSPSDASAAQTTGQAPAPREHKARRTKRGLPRSARRATAPEEARRAPRRHMRLQSSPGAPASGSHPRSTQL